MRYTQLVNGILGEHPDLDLCDAAEQNIMNWKN